MPLLWLFIVFAFFCVNFTARAQASDSLTCAAIYQNALINTNTTNAVFGQPASVAFYSGNIGDTTDSVTPLSTNTPNDGQVYLLQSAIGQPVGPAVAPFDLFVQGSGTITPFPIPAQGWYQIGQTMTLTAAAGRYYAFKGWADGVISTQRTVAVMPTNQYTAIFTNTVPLETNTVDGVTRIAPVGTPWVIIDGQPNTTDIVLATNGAVFSVQLQTSYTNGIIQYTTDGSDPAGSTNVYSTNFNVTAPFTIRAVAFAQGYVFPKSNDSVNTLSVTAPGGGAASATPQIDFYSGVASAVLTAMPATNWSFVGWTGDTSDTNAVTTLPVTAPEAVQAVFGTVVAASTNGNGYVTNYPNQSLYAYGSMVRLEAAALPGSYFVRWGGSLTNMTSPIDFTITNGAPQIQATFSSLSGNNYSLTLLTFGGGDVGATPALPFYPSGTNVVLMATPRTNQSFVGWSGNASGTNNPLTVVMTNNLVISANFAITQPLFVLGSSSYVTSESNGAVAVTVQNLGVLGTNVQFATMDGTALAGSDYTATNGTFKFTNGPSSQTFYVPITDEFLVSTSKSFQVVLSNPGAGGSLGSPSSATVTIQYNDSSNLAQAFPGPAPDTSGSLQVTILPAGIGAQWRFDWELGWRTNGELVTDLAQGNYQLDFSQVAGYVSQSLGPQAVETGGPTTEVTNQYAGNGGGQFGWLTVNLGPNIVTNGGWRLVGQTAWQGSGDTESNLPPGDTLIEFESVNGFSAPPAVQVEVFANAGSLISANYLIANAAPTNVSLPGPLPNAAVISAGLTNSPRLPYAFNGQLESDVGLGSGVAVAQKVVLTAAHLVFNDNTLSYVTHVNWFFQKQSAENDPNPVPLPARGWYVLSSYAAQRTYDLTNGYAAGVSSPQSSDYDVAAVYFTSTSSRGGYGGYLQSDVSPNPYLSSPSLKLLVGYPVDGNSFGYTNIIPGEMHTNPPANYSFALEYNRVYTSGDFLNFPGNSGGPVYVLHTNNIYYPAGVYLGTTSLGLSNVSVVRAIDSNAVELITQAAALGDSGTTNHNGGVITVIANQGVGETAFIEIHILPNSLLNLGAGWRLQGQTGYHTNASDTEAIASNGTAYVEFAPVYGWNSPTNQTVPIALGQTTLIDAQYTPVVWSVTTSVLPAGSGTAGTADGGSAYTNGTSVSVTATNSVCFTFMNWTTSGIVASTSNPYVFTANTNLSVIANFVLNTYPVTVNISPAGAGTVSLGATYPTNFSFSTNCGASLNLMAAANHDWEFTGWTINLGGVVSSNGNASLLLTVTTNATLQANFLGAVQVTVQANPSNAATTFGSGLYVAGQRTNISVSPNSGWNFVKWGDSVTTNLTRTITVPASDKTYTAYFAPTNLVLALGSPPWGANGFNLLLNAPIAGSYRVDVSTNLAAWQVLTNLTTTTSPFPFSDPATNSRQRLYRAAWVP